MSTRHWADRPFTEIRRVDVNQLLDRIEDEHGVRQADTVLDHHPLAHGLAPEPRRQLHVPIVKGMKRDKRLPEQRSRDRILDDDEIRGPVGRPRRGR